MSKKLNHTPGPWTVDGIGEDNAGQQALTITADHTGYVCGIHCADAVYIGPEDHANARLIASSPDLLAALQTISAWLIAPDTSRETINGMQGMCKAAISKATGS